MKKKKIKLLKIYSIISILIIFIFFLIIAVIRYYFIYNETKSKYNDIQKKIKKEEIVAREIEEYKKKVNVESEVERKTQENFMVKLPGEKVIEFVD